MYSKGYILGIIVIYSQKYFLLLRDVFLGTYVGERLNKWGEEFRGKYLMGNILRNKFQGIILCDIFEDQINEYILGGYVLIQELIELKYIILIWDYLIWFDLIWVWVG